MTIVLPPLLWPSIIVGALGGVWVATGLGWYAADPNEYDGPAITEPGALPADRQPYYANPPNDAQRAAREIAIERGEL